MAKKNPFTSGSAVEFDGFSVKNYTLVKMELTCECEPYQDVFTYDRWAAQNFHVRKGEHGHKITTWIPVKKEVDGEVKVVATKPHTTTVFCRCQVDKNEAKLA